MARIDQLEREAWEGWGRSIREKRVTLRERSRDDAGKKRKVAIRTERQAGDPRFLERVGWCVEQRAKIFGFYLQAKLSQEEIEEMLDKYYHARRQREMEGEEKPDEDGMKLASKKVQ